MDDWESDFIRELDNAIESSVAPFIVAHRVFEVSHSYLDDQGYRSVDKIVSLMSRAMDKRLNNPRIEQRAAHNDLRGAVTWLLRDHAEVTRKAGS